VRRHRIEKTGGQPPEAAIAEPGVRFLFDDFQWVELVQLLKMLQDRLEPEIGNIIREGSPHEVFHRKIIDPLGVALLVCLLGLNPALQEDVARRAGCGFKPFARSGFRGGNALIEHQMPFIKRIIAAGEFHGAAAVLFKQIFCIHSVGFGGAEIEEIIRRM
jgi:hypothetical protein